MARKMTTLDDKRRRIEQRGRVREFVFGIQDGLISNLGLVSGIQGATADLKIVLLGGITAAVSGAISMAAGSYLSSKAEKEIFDAEIRAETDRLANEPYLAQEAVLESLKAEGLPRENAYRVVRLMQPRPDILLQTYHEKVLGLGRAEVNRPIQAALVMGASFTVGSVIPLMPYVLAPGSVALPISVAVSTATLFGVGVFKGVLAKKSPWLSGLEFFAIALGSAGLGYALGVVISWMTG
jgi:VIT1/CCC1 family predicted Fe2+/Mn2+ transporter